MLPWFSDEVLVNWVKNRYSPDTRWKDKPFDERDATFFARGMAELSERFTSGRAAKQIDYLSHPKFRSSYLLYFLPLGIQKFDSLFRQYPKIIEKALAEAAKGGVLRIVDLGAGPGTASFALLLHLLQNFSKKLPARIHFHWVDVQPAVMKDGEQLLKKLIADYPGGEIPVEISLEISSAPWLRVVPKLAPFHLALMGQVLNEGHKNDDVLEAIDVLIQKSKGGGVLMVEPADRFSSQYLSQVRDALLEGSEGHHILGPCLHEKKCPLALGRDWCHFSVPVDPKQAGKWFVVFSKKLGSVREWSKYSYIWWAAPDMPRTQPDADLRLVVSDPLEQKWVLLCEPDRVKRHPIHASKLKTMRRGNQIRLAPFREPAAIKAGFKLKKRRVLRGV